MNRGSFSVAFTTPKLEVAFTSCIPLGPPVIKKCGWFHILKNSARKSSCIVSYGSGKCLMKDMSVLTKRGPYSGARLELPSSPRELCTKAQGLNQLGCVAT